jgi:hypothetical protein
MPSYPGRCPQDSRTALRDLADGDPQLLHRALGGLDLDAACARHGVDFGAGPDHVYTPPVTLWVFVTQCLSAGKSCVAAVARLIVLPVALGQPPCSAATGAYCKARAKLPEALLRDLATGLGAALERDAPEAWRWHGRRVVLADGSTLSMPDTPDNQRVYPQPGRQKPGLGFPQLRLVVLLGLATGALLDAATGPTKGKDTGEPALFRQLLAALRAGDVVVADRFYCSYWLVALLRAAGVDVVCRLHQCRHYDFRRGRRLGQHDHVATWAKPAKPDWMDPDTYAALPEELPVRELRVDVDRPGYRTRRLVVATTLSDAATYPRADIAELYHERWQVELDLRSLKQTLHLDVLTCRTPAMVRRELWTHLLAYNLVRQALAEAAQAGQVRPRALSFAGAQQTLAAFRWLLLLAAPGPWREQIVASVRAALATHRVGQRPGRVEPRAVKRRPKEYDRLMKPRAQARAELLAGAQG